MKRMAMLIIVAVVALAADLIMAQEVHSVNVVGFRRFDLAPSGTFVQAAMNFDAFDKTLMGVLSNNQLRASNKVGKGDRVYLWDPSMPGYQIFQLKLSDMQWHNTTNFSGDAVDPGLLAGEGLWVRSPSDAADPVEFSLHGEAVDVGTQAVEIVTGFQLVGYPFSADIDLQDMDFANDGATANNKVGGGDRVYVWDGDGYGIYQLKTDLMWYETTNFGGAPVDVTVPIGQGFWYESKTNFTWTETNRYLGNL